MPYTENATAVATTAVLLFQLEGLLHHPPPESECLSRVDAEQGRGIRGKDEEIDS